MSTMRRNLRLRLAATVLVALAAGLALFPRPAAADGVHPNHAQGFEPQKAYTLGEIESVNLFNGNLQLTIPLGQTYPVGGALSYGLTLSYTGNVWEWEEAYDPTYRVWYLKAVPRLRSNAGLGWLLSLGRIYGPDHPSLVGSTLSTFYESPDGALHRLVPSLHPASPVHPDYLYTEDGTYLRIYAPDGPDGGTDPDFYQLELPDGQIHDFDATGLLTKIRDRFGNSLTVTYPASASHPGIDDWRLADSHGRVHFVRFQPGANGPVVAQVELESFGGGTAVYDFTTDETTIPRGWTTPEAITAYGVSREVDVDLLTEVRQPDGSTYSMPVWPGYDLGPPSGNESTSGHLLQMRLPTGGYYEYLWQQYLYPLRTGHIQPLMSLNGGIDGRNPFTQSSGVAWRRRMDRSQTVLGQWIHEPELDASVPGKEHQVKVTDPLGHYTVHYFSVYVDDGMPLTPEPAGWERGEYGLPFSRNVSAGGRFLSSETYRSGGALFQTQFVNYERDGIGTTSANPRLSRKRTYHKSDSAGSYTGVVYSDWDGLGHYRTATTEGTLGTGGNVRTTYTAYSPGSGPTGQPATSTPWILGTYTLQRVTEGGVSAEREACFDPATGALERERIPAGTGSTRSGDDVVRAFLRDASGNLVRESLYGGDTQTVGTGGLCTLALPATPEHRVDHTWQYGSLATSQVFGVPERSVDRSIDRSTGKATRSLDTAFIPTDFTYDALGRLTWVKPRDDAWQQVIYRHGGTLSPRVEVLHLANGGGSTRTTERHVFDDLGRLYTHQILMPDGSWAGQITLYDAASHVRSVSTRGDASKTTQYLGYDPAGRPTTVRPPDSTSANGYAHDVVTVHKGVREVQRTVSVGTGWNASTQTVAESSSTSTMLYDGQGRLVQVSEPANPDGTNATTFYAYDIGGRLSSMTQAAKGPFGTSASQTRLFQYDQRGFLTAERHPEKGSFGNGWVYYHDHDPLGNAGRRQDGPHGLTYQYDAAKRLTQVRETGTGGRVLQEYVYATASGSGDARRGKLWKAVSHDHPVIGSQGFTVTTDETYRYGGRQGRVSQRDTSVVITADGGSPGAADSFTQTWAWNDLGNVSSQTYPECTVAARCSAPSPRTVSYGYTRGRLTSISGVVDSISYWKNGQPYVVARSNGVVDVWRRDAVNLARPAKIEGRIGSASGTVFWSTGQYVFDGAGNLVKNGLGHTLYDSVSRVSSGTLYLGPGSTGGGTASWSVGYDGFGNIQSMTTATSRSTPTDLATNRLTGSVSYDGAGNMTSWNGALYAFDALDRLWQVTNGSQDWRHMYTADGERLLSFRANGGPSRWVLRDLDGRPLREYENDAGVWSVVKDYVYRGSHVVVAYTAEAFPRDLQHLHTDHLGTVRAATDGTGTRIAYHQFYPFGEEATSIAQSTERLKFTGHERDLGSLYSAADDLDYMHARYYNPQVGRFLSFDPIGGNPAAPQSWNRYGYVMGNPFSFIDPDGLRPLKATELQFFNTFFGADFSTVDVKSGVLAKSITSAAGASGVALGETIFLSSTSAKAFDQGALQAVALVGHELTHVLQYRALGMVRFLDLYMLDYSFNRSQGQSDGEAYRNIVAEQVARKFQRSMAVFLDRNPGISAKLVSGATFSESELELIGSALRKTMAEEGNLAEGFQIIQGELIRIELKE